MEKDVRNQQIYGIATSVAFLLCFFVMPFSKFIFSLSGYDFIRLALSASDEETKIAGILLLLALISGVAGLIYFIARKIDNGSFSGFLGLILYIIIFILTGSDELKYLGAGAWLAALSFLAMGCAFIIPKSFNYQQKVLCPNCGNEVSVNSKFCGNCGNKVEEIKPEWAVCLKCGREVEDSNYCEHCCAAILTGAPTEKTNSSVMEDSTTQKMVPEKKKQNKSSVDLTCPFCCREIEIDKKDIENKQFICPKCNRCIDM